MANKVSCCCGCGPSCDPEPAPKQPMHTDSRITVNDKLGTLRMRLGLGRSTYRVTPGLYALGNPGRTSHVFASANYKLSFDTLRSALDGLDAWILVLDTKGINVWCAAGKGTFGTDELTRKIRETNLGDRVDAKRIIVPQLGAPGVAAHEVERATGFRVVYGPVRACDIKGFIDGGLQASGDMRRVRFNLADRAKLVFVEFGGAFKYLLLAMLAIVAISFFARGMRFPGAVIAGIIDATGAFAAVIAGTVLAPLLLPWLPGRSFSFKGIITGAAAGLAFVALAGKTPAEAAAWLSAIIAVSSFLSMGFTGASTYTNLSGTVREMTIYIPVQISLAAAGTIMFIALGILAGKGV